MTTYKITATIVVEEVPTQPQPARAVLQIGGVMPGAITVDTTNETATVEFVDDRGDVTGVPGGATVVFRSSDEAVVTVAAAADNPLQAQVTPVAIGEADVSVDIQGTVDAAGVPITVDPVHVTVSAGEAVGATLTLSV